MNGWCTDLSKLQWSLVRTTIPTNYFTVWTVDALEGNPYECFLMRCFYQQDDIFCQCLFKTYMKIRKMMYVFF